MLKAAIETASLHHHRAMSNYQEIKAYDLSISLFDETEKIKTIDAFIFRFIKLQDFMSEKLFRRLLEAVGEYKDSMSLLDVLDKLEKLKVLKDVDQWIAIRKLRNQLTHEYPDNREDVLDGIKMALAYFESIGNLLQSIIDYSHQKRLLKET